MTTERTVDFTENAQKEIRDAMKKTNLKVMLLTFT